LESAQGALSAGVKARSGRGVHEVDAYQLAKYNRESTVKLRDVLFSATPSRKRGAAALWKKLVENTLELPTRGVALSAGKDKRETWERLLREGKLGGMAVLRNLRLMLAAGVAPKLVADRLERASPALCRSASSPRRGTLRNSRKQSKKRC